MKKILIVWVMFVITVITSCQAGDTRQTNTDENADTIIIKAIQQAKGIHHVSLKGKFKESAEIRIYNVNTPQGKLPPFETVQGELLRSGVMSYLENMDVMDRDIFYMKLHKEEKEGFLKLTRSKNIPDVKAIELMKLIKANHFEAMLSIKDSTDKEISFISLSQPVQSIITHAKGYRFVCNSEVLEWERLTNKFILNPITTAKNNAKP